MKPCDVYVPLGRSASWIRDTPLGAAGSRRSVSLDAASSWLSPRLRCATQTAKLPCSPSLICVKGEKPMSRNAGDPSQSGDAVGLLATWCPAPHWHEFGHIHRLGCRYRCDLLAIGHGWQHFVLANVINTGFRDQGWGSRNFSESLVLLVKRRHQGAAVSAMRRVRKALTFPGRPFRCSCFFAIAACCISLPLERRHRPAGISEHDGICVSPSLQRTIATTSCPTHVRSSRQPSRPGTGKPLHLTTCAHNSCL